ncbi:MAG: ATP-binding protein [Thermodesulfobacteriota bacterium]|nr:ATP-binding protein [Thermodesulfobacteriota bacterium]
MIIPRPDWIKKINSAWNKRPVAWLSGVRRAGKTTLAGMFEDARYLNCDLPSTVRQLQDPELFYDSLKKGRRVIFDEVHRLDDPSRILKIGADIYPHLKILATGSSTLAATKKFRDALTGRKQMIYLPPVSWLECNTGFGIKDLDKRMMHGGLPESLLSDTLDTDFFSEWIDSFYARDVQELFGVRSRSGFLKLLQLLMFQSGGLVDYTQLAKSAELSRPTVKSYLEAMSISHAVCLLPPFHGSGKREIISRPKCYAFDTGFICFVRGWENLRNEDRGILWEHLVLDELRINTTSGSLYYWRDKSGREIDFVIKKRENRIHVVECKINVDNFSPDTLSAFRDIYPHGKNYVLSPNVKTPYQRQHGENRVMYCTLDSEFVHQIAETAD